MGNHLRLFPEASDWPEGWEQPVWAVGGQGELQEVTQPPSMLETCFFFKPRFFGMGNHLRPFPEASDWPEGWEQPVWAVGGQEELQEVTWIPRWCYTSDMYFFKPPCFWAPTEHQNTRTPPEHQQNTGGDQVVFDVLVFWFSGGVLVFF